MSVSKNSSQIDSPRREDLAVYCLRLADDRLVLGHRLSEWCRFGPTLEEDIALTNIALDLVGEANHLYTIVGTLRGDGKSPDDLAYLRDEREYTNVTLVEVPRGDFAVTITRQFFFDVYSALLFEKLSTSTFEDLAGIAARSLKETRYHLRHSSEWMLRLGDGTEESHRRVQEAVDALWMYTGELFESDDIEKRLAEVGLAPLSSDFESSWKEQVAAVLKQATLSEPRDTHQATGGRSGLHTEHLGHMLAEMQILPRSYPGAKW